MTLHSAQKPRDMAFLIFQTAKEEEKTRSRLIRRPPLSGPGNIQRLPGGDKILAKNFCQPSQMLKVRPLSPLTKIQRRYVLKYTLFNYLFVSILCSYYQIQFRVSYYF